MKSAQLPPIPAKYPENAAGSITLDQAVMLMKQGDLSYEGACYLLPVMAWPFLPKQTPKSPRANAQPKRRGCLCGLKFWRKRHD
jgi:hypothetical protein